MKHKIEHGIERHCALDFTFLALNLIEMSARMSDNVITNTAGSGSTLGVLIMIIL